MFPVLMTPGERLARDLLSTTPPSQTILRTTAYNVCTPLPPEDAALHLARSCAGIVIGMSVRLDEGAIAGASPDRLRVLGLGIGLGTPESTSPASGAAAGPSLVFHAAATSRLGGAASCTKV